MIQTTLKVKSESSTTEAACGQSSSESNAENVVFKLELEPDPSTDVQSPPHQQPPQMPASELSLSVDSNKPFDMNISNIGECEKRDFSLSQTQSVVADDHRHEQKEESQHSQMPPVPRPDGSVPLAVPMMANTMHSSVTRNDAKKITETRLKRLRHLSQTSEELLPKPQKDEKKRIIRLEKNRRAAAMSRRKKKIYVKNLEENSKLMARHIAILEMENNHLRAMMSVSQPGSSMQPFPPMHPMYKVPQQMHSFMAAPNGNNQPFAGSVPSMPSSTTSLEPPLKRRKIESSTASMSDVCSEIDGTIDGNANSLEPEPMEPLPLPIPVNAPPAPPSMPRMVPMNMAGHMMAANMGMHPSRMMPYPMQRGMNGMNPMMMHQNGMAVPAPPSSAAPPRVFAPEIGKLDVTVTDVNEQSNHKEHGVLHDDQCERKSVETDDGYGGYMDTEVMNLSILDDHDDIAVIDETVDECGSVIGFQADTKSAQMVFL